MDDEPRWACALLSAEVPVPAGLKTWNNSDPASRFAVYRNNVLVSLVNALEDSFPVTRQLVGEAFFRTMAIEFVRGNPPRAAVLTDYGDALPEFVEAYPHARALPYLADMTRLEMAYLQAYHAADAQPISAEEITALLTSPQTTTRTRFQLHPSLRTLVSRHPVISLWAAHQDKDAIQGALQTALTEIDMQTAESCWLLRRELQVVVIRMTPGDCLFAEKLRQGSSLEISANCALDADPDFDLAACLAVMLREGAIVSVA
ncbi:HvfC/BufC N-terminal domain-containing protein [Microbulbifer hainanensis]|uniref:HvfC/BufC N-terminal domain-containing protein n=1 Tax=Microbulbifer hainanensis TaxID=2735675 RepID=UPI001865CE49|nr:DNA-binding domain-containing protein [Microbulbifer hainanensis]